MSRILLLLGQYDITWNAFAQMTDGTFQPLSNYHELQFDGTNFGDKQFLGFYQDSTHVLDSTGVHVCSAGPHVKNPKFVTNTTVSQDGAGSTNLPVSTANCSLKLVFNIGSSVATNGARFFSYDGNIDSVPMPNSIFKAAEGGVSTSWKDANGYLSALLVADQAAATTHTFYLACSYSPTTLGLQTGKVKLTFNYI